MENGIAENGSSSPSASKNLTLERRLWQGRRLKRESDSRNGVVKVDEKMKLGCREPEVGMIFARGDKSSSGSDRSG